MYRGLACSLVTLRLVNLNRVCITLHYITLHITLQAVAPIISTRILHFDPLRVASQDTASEQLEIARLLIDAGYDLNDRPYRSSWYKFGGTAIKMAAEQGELDIVKLMLERGADPDIPGRYRHRRLYTSTVPRRNGTVGGSI